MQPLQQPALCRVEVQCMREEVQMNLREAAQQALEALWFANTQDWHGNATIWKAISTLQSALAQPEQEPVAWMHTNGVGHVYFRLKPQDKVFNPVPLYTHPPHREWQGLTDEERRHIYATTEEFGHEIARAVEASLKEKNHE